MHPRASDTSIAGQPRVALVSSEHRGHPLSRRPAETRPSNAIPELSVNVAGDADRAVPQQVGYRLDMHACLEPGHRGAVPQVCTPTSAMPALAAACSMVRRTLRGSTGVPNSVVNTSRCRSTGCRRSRSAAWAARWDLSSATMAGDSGTVRRDRGDFGSAMSSRSPTRLSVAATLSARP